MTREEIKDFCDMKVQMEPENEDIFKAIVKALEQEPFINKPCVSSEVCEHDKQKALDKIRAEIEQIEINGHIRDVECFRAGINTVLNVIDKYKVESEPQESEK